MIESNKKLEEVYFYWLDRAAKAYKNYAHQMFKALGIDLTDDQWMALKRIHEESGINQKTLSKAIHKDPASITRILDNLVKKELIIRNMGDDRRTFNLSVTDAGNKIVAQVIPLAVEARAKGLEGMSTAEGKQLIEMLKKIQDNFS